MLTPAFDLLQMAINPLGSAVQYISDNFGRLMDWLGQFSGWFEQETLDPAAAAEWEAWGRGLADGVISGIKYPFQQLESLKQEMLTLGAGIVQSLWDGMKAKFGEFIEFVKGIPGQIIDAIGKIDLTSAISWPKMPTWLGGEPDTPAPASLDHRAVGGAFAPGPMIVGERGPELRFEDRAGFIATHRQYHNLRGAAETINRAASSGLRVAAPQGGPVSVGGITIHAPPGTSPSQIADEVMRRLKAATRGALYDGAHA